MNQDQVNMTQMQSVESTYKSKDTEEFLDRLFYRPVGYVMALISKSLGLTPNSVTVLSIFVGIAAGHLFYYPELNINLIGMLLLIIAEAMDSADGQLARITNTKSRYGRILDGFAGNLWFFSIYVHLCLRFINGGGTPLIFILALAAGASHSVQSAMADYFRNFYVWFVLGSSKSEIDESVKLKTEYKELTWNKNSFKKLLMRIYINYTVEQEMFSGKLRELYGAAKTKFGGNIPLWLKSEYRNLIKPLIKYFNILTTNTRMIVLFITLFINIPVLYFIFELTVFNFLLAYVIYTHNRHNQYMITMINNSDRTDQPDNE